MRRDDQSELGPPVSMIVLWLDRRDIVPPPFIAWTPGIWAVVAAVIFEPAPWVLTWLGSDCLLAGARRSARYPEPAPDLSEV